MPQYPYAPTSTDLGALITLSAQSTGTVSSAKQTNTVATGVQIRLYVTAESGTTPTVALTVQGYDPASGEYYTVAAGTGIDVAANTMYTYTIYPGIGTGSGDFLGVNAALPKYWRVSATIAGTTPSVTGTISACTLV